MQAVNSRIVGLVALEPQQQIVTSQASPHAPHNRLCNRSNRRATLRQLDHLSDTAPPTRIVSANLAALRQDLQRELQDFYAKLEAVTPA
ncbi:MAG: hypothetical protein GTO03_05860 [Planctomycetales bacterium]|nr:hypothetical protein [Planctomycetales bacterium]